MPRSSSPPSPTNRTPHPEDWRPHVGPQSRFLGLRCFEALYGGAAGGGKSDALLVDAIRYVGRGYGRNYKALILRRTFPPLERELIPRSYVLYPRLGGQFNRASKTWTFPGGETVHFGHCQHEFDVHQYQGVAWQFVGFDELTQFYESQYLYLIGRTRSAHSVPIRLRATTNPGGDGHEWVFRRFGAWLDPASVLRGDPGKVLWFYRDEGGAEHSVDRDTADAMNAEHDAATVAERKERGLPRVIGRTFVPASLADNPTLAADGVYARGLEELDPVTRAQLRDGNWLIKPAAGHYFKRAWFQFVDLAPAEAHRIRFWDRAATEPKAGRDPDWTIGVRLARTPGGICYVENVVRIRGTPGTVEATILATAELDGKDIEIGIPEDPGSAGKSEAATTIKALAGWNVRAHRSTGDKVTRAGPVSAQCEAGNVKLVRGAWNEPFLEVLESFPDGTHDDDVDGLSGAFNELTANGPVSYQIF